MPHIIHIRDVWLNHHFLLPFSNFSSMNLSKSDLLLCQQDTIPTLTLGKEQAPAKHKCQQKQIFPTRFAKHISAVRARAITAFVLISPWVGFIFSNLSVAVVSQLL